MSEANKSINRPPTPEPEDNRELSLEESVQLKVGERQHIICVSAASHAAALLCSGLRLYDMLCAVQLVQSGEKER
jgi:hypothetical protein